MILRTGQQKNSKERMFYSFRERTIFPKITNFDEKSPLNFMTKSLLDILERSRLSMRSKNTTGGLECEPSSRIMLKEAEFAKNSR